MFLFANESSYIFFTILAVLGSIILIVLLMFLIKHNIKRYNEESDVILNEALSKTEMRRKINKYISKVGAYGACSFLYIDLDGFADLNEILGRKACDEILKQVALKIVRTLPYNAQFSLFTGDEFIVFIKEQNDRDSIERLAKRICESVNTDYHITLAADINLTCSIGGASYPMCGTTLPELLTNLELATYISKRDGGNRFTYYYSTLGEEERDNYKFYQEIKQAIKNKEFVLYYQPMINIDKNTIFGAEALMRWEHPTKGIVSPSEFIPILEQSGDIKWVGEWGLETIVKEYLTMASKYPEFDLKLSLNLSTKQLLDSKLSQTFIDIVKKYGVEPSHFMLEIGEYNAYERLGQVKNNLLRLRDYGFLVAVEGLDLDESALSDIERAPIDVIKLNRSFLSDTKKSAVREKFVELLIEYAKSYNHELICEGVENNEMVEYIKGHGIDYAQGYYYSKPISEEEFDRYVANRKWREVNKAQYVEQFGDKDFQVPKKKEPEIVLPDMPEIKFEQPVVEPQVANQDNQENLDFLEDIKDDLFSDVQ